MGTGLGIGSVILLWSTSSVLIYLFKPLIGWRAAAPCAVWLATAGAVLVALLKPRWLRRTFDIDLRREWRGLLFLIALSALAFVVYPLCYFYAIHSDLPLQANVLNYLWPLVSTFVGFAVRRARFRYEWLFGVLVAFLGALMATESFPWATSALHSAPGRWKWGLIAAAGGAVAYGLYVGAQFKLQIRARSGETLDASRTYLLMLVAASVMHLAVALIPPSPLRGIAWPTPSVGMLAFVAYSFLNLCLAHFVFFWLTRQPTVPIALTSSRVYIIPLLSTVFLASIVGVGVLGSGRSLMAGMCMLLIGTYLSGVVYVAPVAAMFLVVAVSCALLAVMPADAQAVSAANLASYVDLLGLLATLFAIVSGFILTRVVQLHLEAKRKFLHTHYLLHRLAHSAKSNPEALRTLDEMRIALIDDYVRAAELVVEWDDPRAPDELAEQLAKARAVLSSPAELDSFVESRWEWWYLSRERVTDFEKLSLAILVGALAYFALLVPWNDPRMSGGLIVALAASVLVTCAVRDFASSRPAHMAAYLVRLQLQFPLDEHDARLRMPYVPELLVQESRWPRDLKGHCPRIRVKSTGDGADATGFKEIACPGDQASMVQWIVVALVYILLGIAWLQ